MSEKASNNLFFFSVQRFQNENGMLKPGFPETSVIRLIS